MLNISFSGVLTYIPENVFFLQSNTEPPTMTQTDLNDILSSAFGVAFCVALLVSFFAL